jgi:hypothetical protein
MVIKTSLAWGEMGQNLSVWLDPFKKGVKNEERGHFGCIPGAAIGLTQTSQVSAETLRQNFCRNVNFKRHSTTKN